MLKYVLWLCLLVPATASAGFGASGNRVNYRDTQMKVAYAGTGPVVVATLDSRAFIINGDKPASFVGQIRGGFGNPFQVRTESGQALSQDISASIAAALAGAGYTATVDAVAKDETPDQAAARLAAKTSGRVVIVQLRDWKSDTYMTTTLRYDVTISTYDAQGRKIDSVVAQGEETPMVKVGFSLKPTLAAIAAIYHDKFQAWLNDDKTRVALAAATATVPAPAAEAASSP